MNELAPQKYVLPVVTVDLAERWTAGVHGSAWLASSGLVVTCRHCLPSPLPEGHVVAVAVKSETGSYQAYPLYAVEADPRGFDLATARVDLSCDDPLPLYAGVGKIGMPVWSFGYPMPSLRPEPGLRVGVSIYPRYLQGYVTRRFLGDPATFPKLELDMPAPPGLSGAPLVLRGSDQVVGIVFGRQTVQVPDEDPAPLYHFGLAMDRETLDGLRGAATGGKELAEVLRTAKSAHGGMTTQQRRCMTPSSELRRRLLIFSPVGLIVACHLLQRAAGDALGVWAWVPTMTVFWATIAGLIAWARGRQALGRWLQAPQGSWMWSVLAVAVGLVSVREFLADWNVLQSATVFSLWLGFGLINPWFEESYWRGLMLDATATWVGGLGVVYSTLLFVVSHRLIWGVHSVALRHPAALAGLVIVGAVWSVAYRRTGSLRWTIAGHALANLLGLSVPMLLNLHIPAALR
jgi:hypothetical protein